MHGKTSLVLFLITVKMVFGLEPQCSPFHYQEQMIEKMVKLEIFVQKMKDDIAALQHRVMDEIEILKVDKKLLKSDFETEKSSITNVVQQIMNTNDALMKNISLTFQEMVEANSGEIRKYEKEVEAIKESAVTPTVAFYAKEVSSTALVSGATFIYKTTVLNEGHGYDNTTGRFTATVGGTYLFTVQFCVQSGSSNFVIYAIVLDGFEMKRGLFYDNDSNKCYTADVIVILKSGAQVWVTGLEVSGSLLKHENWKTWNTFSGVLLHK